MRIDCAGEPRWTVGRRVKADDLDVEPERASELDPSVRLSDRRSISSGRTIRLAVVGTAKHG
jgi:hypothetical protein